MPAPATTTPAAITTTTVSRHCIDPEHPTNTNTKMSIRTNTRNPHKPRTHYLPTCKNLHKDPWRFPFLECLPLTSQPTTTCDSRANKNLMNLAD